LVYRSIRHSTGRVVTLLLFVLFVFLQDNAFSQKKDTLILQQDTVIQKAKPRPVTSRDSAAATVKKDSTLKKKRDPGKASLYSAILPGAGQVYNHKYWKVPIVYAAVGIPAYLFFYNKSWYKKCQYALAVSINGSTGDSLAKVDPNLKPLLPYPTYIIDSRDTFRKNQDYAALFFLLFWGLNIVDATVDAHLHDFSVSNDLSFRVKPMFIPGPNLVAGVSFVFDIHKGKTKLIDLNN
jgi:Family of unknown function (DUF5683)